MTIAPIDLAVLALPSARKRGAWAYIRRHPTIVFGATLLGLMALMAIFAPYLGTVDPQALSPIRRLRWPSAQYWFGTDMLGRDIYSRTIYGARISLTVGLSVALLSTALGLAIGLVTGFSRWTDADRDADHGRPDVDPVHPDRDRVDGLDPRQPRECRSSRSPLPRCRVIPASSAASC